MANDIIAASSEKIKCSRIQEGPFGGVYCDHILCYSKSYKVSMTLANCDRNNPKSPAKRCPTCISNVSSPRQPAQLHELCARPVSNHERKIYPL